MSTPIDSGDRRFTSGNASMEVLPDENRVVVTLDDNRRLEVRFDDVDDVMTLATFTSGYLASILPPPAPVIE